MDWLQGAKDLSPRIVGLSHGAATQDGQERRSKSKDGHDPPLLRIRKFQRPEQGPRTPRGGERKGQQLQTPAPISVVDAHFLASSAWRLSRALRAACCSAFLTLLSAALA